MNVPTNSPQPRARLAGGTREPTERSPGRKATAKAADKPLSYSLSDHQLPLWWWLGVAALRLDDRNEIMLPAGRHDLRLVNRAIEYDVVRHVELKPGETIRLVVEVPRSTMTVTASEPAEVRLDGVRVGETPLASLPVDVGAHELVLKQATGAERRFPVTVTMKPFALHVDFSNPGR